MTTDISARTNGSTIDCRGCRYWSEMIARCRGAGPVQAMCLSPDRLAKRGEYTYGNQTCEVWASGHLGAVDEPGDDPDRYSWNEGQA